MVYTAPNGTKYNMRVGSRAQVMHRTAYKTSGGLLLVDLKMNKWGRIVSKRKQEAGKKLYKKYKDVLKANRAPSF